MYRRTFLAGVALGSAPLVVGTPATAGNDDRIDDQTAASPRCGGTFDDDALRAPDGPPDFELIADGRTIAVYWVDAEWFGDDAESVVGRAGGDTIILNRGEAGWIDHAVLAHEVGHCLGWGHVDGTLMDPFVFGADDADAETELSNPTQKIIAAIDGYRLCAWTVADVRAIINAWVHGETTIDHARYAINRWSADEYSDAYFGAGWDGFGGEFEPTDRRCRAGVYYGRPVDA